METHAPPPRPPTNTTPPPKQPWPMSWILIAILIYVTFQVGYILFFAE